MADALSRQHEMAGCISIVSFPIWRENEEAEKEIAQDPVQQKIVQDLQQGSCS